MQATVARELVPGPPAARHVVDRFLRLRELQRDVLGTIGKRFATYGDAHKAEVLGPAGYCLRHPDAIHDVLVTFASHFGKRKLNLELLGDGLLLSDGDVWRRQRRRVQPGFRHESISRYVQIIEEETERTLAGWAPGAVVELGSSMMELTLRVVCRALFGQDFRGNSQRLARILGRLQAFAVQPALLPGWAPSPIRLWRSHLRRLVDREVYAIIDAATPGTGSLLAELKAPADPENAMSRRELRDEIVTLFLAGHETTALSLSWAFQLIARHPEVDAGVFAEVAELPPGSPAHRFDPEALELTGRAYKESLRLYPPAYVLPRLCREPTNIAGCMIQPGEEVWLWIYFMQRDPRWFQEPDRFHPGRFLRDGEQARNPRAYMPFGAGSRACIGRHFATFEAVLVLARVLQRYRLEPLDPRLPSPRARVTLAPECPVPVRLHARR